MLVKVNMEWDSPSDPTHNQNPRDVADVYVLYASQQAMSLFEDDGIMSDLDNLAVYLGNPFGRYKSPDGRLGEVNSGLWYNRAYNHLKIGDRGYPKFLIGVILYMDKTGTSVQQRHGLEPLMMTFSLFKEHIRNQTFRSRRPLGYIPKTRDKKR